MSHSLRNEKSFYNIGTQGSLTQIWKLVKKFWCNITSHIFESFSITIECGSFGWWRKVVFCSQNLFILWIFLNFLHLKWLCGNLRKKTWFSWVHFFFHFNCCSFNNQVCCFTNNEIFHSVEKVYRGWVSVWASQSSDTTEKVFKSILVQMWCQNEFNSMSRWQLIIECKQGPAASYNPFLERQICCFLSNPSHILNNLNHLIHSCHLLFQVDSKSAFKFIGGEFQPWVHHIKPENSKSSISSCVYTMAKILLR